LGALALALAAGACTTTRVMTDWDSQVDLRQYQTFAIQTAHVMRDGEPDPGDTLVRDRINAQLRAELGEKGLREVAASPDLLIRYTTDTRTRFEAHHDPVWWGFGWYWEPYWRWNPYWSMYPMTPTLWIDEVEESRMIIDIVDARTNKLVYRARTEDADKDFRSPRHIGKVVDRAFAKYPESGTY
jgi:hypothetical protein